MKSFSACSILAVALAVVVVADDYDKCKNDFKSFLGCVKSEYQKKTDADKDAAKKERREKADKCFTDNSCSVPDWDANPLGGKGKGGSGKGMPGMDMPQVVKDCLKKKILDKVGDTMKACLSRKGINNLNFSAMADMAGSGFDMHGGDGDEAKAGLEGGMKAKFNAVKAVDNCAQKNGGNTDAPAVQKVEQCLQKVKNGEKKNVCSLIKPCMAKVTTGDCKKRGEDLAKALCQCKKEKEAEISKKLKTLGKSQAKVGIQDLMKTVAGDQDMSDMMQQVEKCYSENNVEEPAILKMAVAMMSNGGGSGGPAAALTARFAVNGTTVVIMGDMMALDAADDTECQSCP